jgi:hypothetical protein
MSDTYIVLHLICNEIGCDVHVAELTRKLILDPDGRISFKVYKTGRSVYVSVETVM